MGGPFVASRGPWALSSAQEIAAAIGSTSAIDPSASPYSCDVTGATDSNTGWQLAVAASNAACVPIIVWPDWVIKVSGTTTFTADGAGMVCPSGSPQIGQYGLESVSDMRPGATLQYTGTDVAVRFGRDVSWSGAVPTGSANTFQNRPIMVGVRVEAPANAKGGVSAWQPNLGTFERISVCGPVGTGVRLFAAYGAIATLFRGIDATGLGYPQVGSDYTAFAEFGLYNGLGYSNGTPTTSVWDTCYSHYCKTAVQDYGGCIWRNSVAESSYHLWDVATNAITWLRDCWLENPAGGRPFTMGSNVAVSIHGGRANIYAQQTFFYGSAGGIKSIEMGGGFGVFSNHATPILFDTTCGLDVSNPKAYAKIDVPLPATCTIGGYVDVSFGPSMAYPRVTSALHRYATYEWEWTGSGTANPFGAHDAGHAVRMPEDGVIVQTSVSAGLSPTGGSGWSLSVNTDKKTNNVALFSVGWTTDGWATKNAVFHGTDCAVDAGDRVAPYFATNGVSTSQTFRIRVTVAHGKLRGLLQ